MEKILKNFLVGNFFGDMYYSYLQDLGINRAKRIKKIYGKDSVVIYPPVDVESFNISAIKEDHYVTAGRLVSYKRVDIIVDAFSLMREKKLIVIGNGPELKRLKNRATLNIEFLGYLERQKITYYLSRAKAFIFAAEEDFGILPVESQACGTPVIAYKAGGALETVLENKTGIFLIDNPLRQSLRL